jgi:hypothetical protein
MSTDKIKVENVLKDYFQGYLKAEKHLIEKAFHPETRLFSVDKGKLDKTEMSDWLKNIESRKAKGDERNADQEIIFIEITDDAAIAKVILTFSKYKFTDYLSLLRIQDQWQIIGKIYTVQALN